MLNVNLQNHRDGNFERPSKIISSFMITSIAMTGVLLAFSDQPKNDLKSLVNASSFFSMIQILAFLSVSGADNERYSEFMKFFNSQSRFMAVTGISINAGKYALTQNSDYSIGMVVGVMALSFSFVLESVRQFPVYSLNYILQKLQEGITGEGIPVAEVVRDGQDLNVPVADARPLGRIHQD